MHAPSSVAEVTPDLSQDDPLRVRHERHASLGLVPIDRLDQSLTGCLVQILRRLASSLVSASQPPCVWQEPDDDRLARPRVTRRAPPEQTSEIASRPVTLAQHAP